MLHVQYFEVSSGYKALAVTQFYAKTLAASSKRHFSCHWNCFPKSDNDFCMPCFYNIGFFVYFFHHSILLHGTHF